MDGLLQDLRFALRALRRSPGFAAVAILTLALGIGLTTSVFTIINGVLLRPLPYAAPERLAVLWTTGQDVAGPSNRLPLSAANFLDVEARATAFEQLAAFRASSYTLSEGEEAELLDGARVSAEFFPVLGARPLLGRSFSPEEDRSGAARVVVLSHALWQRRFGGSAGIIGRQITLGEERFTVVGVMPPGFTFPRGAELPTGLQFPPRTELWTPMAFTEREAANRGTLNLAAVGRLRPGVSLDAAQAELSAIARSLSDEFPPFAEGYGMTAIGLREQAVGAIRSHLLLLLGAAAFVLLISCTNVASLLIARTLARQREIAVRQALGAGAIRLVRQLVTENLLHSLGAALAGVLFALWATEAMLHLVPNELPRVDDVAVDLRVLALALAIAAGTGVVFGLASAVYASRQPLASSLQAGGGRSTGGSGQRRLRRALVAAEVALSLVLLIGGGLLVASFLRLQRVPPGFQPHDALAAGLLLPIGPDFDQQRDGPRWLATFDRYLERVSALPGVQAVGGVSALPLSGAVESIDFRIEGRPDPESGRRTPVAEYAVVTPDYFRAIGIPLRQGRTFTTADRPEGALTVVINEALARRFWPGESPLGRRLLVGFGERQPREIIGVVGDVRQTGLDAEPQPAIYFPLAQMPYPFLTIVVRTAGAPLGYAPALRRELRALDPALAFSDLRSLESVFAESLAQQRFSMTLVGVFAVAALLLALVGLYAAVAFAVGQRTREIGVRMALGASPADALRLVLGEGLRVITVGLAAGLVGALLLTRLLQSQLYGISPTEPLVYLGVALLLMLMSLLASYLPARRAARVDPMIVLRAE